MIYNRFIHLRLLPLAVNRLNSALALRLASEPTLDAVVSMDEPRPWMHDRHVLAPLLEHYDRRMVRNLFQPTNLRCVHPFEKVWVPDPTHLVSRP